MRNRALFGNLVRRAIPEEPPWTALIRRHKQQAPKWRRIGGGGGDGSRVSFWPEWPAGRSPIRGCIQAPLDSLSSSKEWVLDRLPLDLPADVGATIKGVPLRFYRAAGDSAALWGFTADGQFACLLRSKIQPWNWDWRIHTIPSIGSVVWLCCKDSLAATLTTLKPPSSAGKEPETVSQILRDSNAARAVWEQSGIPAALCQSFSLPVHDWLRLSCSPRLSASLNVQWGSLLSFVIWDVWMNQNSQFFGRQPIHWNIFLLSKQLPAELQPVLEFSWPVTKQNIDVSWSPPPSGYHELNTDEIGSWIFGFSLNLGSADSVIAELRAQVEFGRRTRSNETHRALCQKYEDVPGAHLLLEAH